MDGITIDSGDKPVFLFQKFNGQPPQIVVAATLAMVDSMGMDVVFGRIFRWKIDSAAKRVIERDAREVLAEHGQTLDPDTKKKAHIAGALRVIMCHEMHIMDGDADNDAATFNIEDKIANMTGIGRMHEDDLATLISPSGCVVTSRSGLMNAMHGMAFERVATSDSHEMVLFYDDGGTNFGDTLDDILGNNPKTDPESPSDSK